MTNPNSTPSRIDYAMTVLDDPTDPGTYIVDEHRLIVSPSHIEAARREMNEELQVRHWSQLATQYPRTVIGKFHSAGDGGFQRIGMDAGESCGRFLRGQFLHGSYMERVRRVLSGAERGMDTASMAGASFLIGHPLQEQNEVTVAPLTFLQFQDRRFAPSSRDHALPFDTTFYFPLELAKQFVADVQKNPDLIADVFANAVAPGLPEPVYCTESHQLGMIDPPALKKAENKRFGPEKFASLCQSAMWYRYKRPHGGEMPQSI